MTDAPVRPWTSNRAERRRVHPHQWWSFPAGAAVRCPSPDCDRFVVELGAKLGVEVRVHPGGKLGKPSHPQGQAILCDCGLRLDMRPALGLDPVPMRPPSVGGGAAAA